MLYCFSVKNERDVAFMSEKKKNGVISKFIGEFKEFISKGSVLDMAVGVIVGGAFTAIINSLVNDILMPVIGAILVGVNFTNLGFHIPWGNEPYINVGSFITAVITFLLTALCVFIFVKVVNTLRNIGKKKPEAPVPTTKKCPYCLSEIALEATRCPHCTSVIELPKEEEKEAVAAAEAE